MKKSLFKYKGYMITSVICVVIVSASMLIQPALLATVLNDGVQNVDESGIPSPDIEVVDTYGILLVILAVIGLIAGIVNAMLAARISQKVGSDLRTEMFTKIQNYSFSDIEKFKPSNLVVRMTNDVNQVQILINMLFQQLIRIPVLFIGAFILAMSIFPTLWWIIVVEIAVVMVVLAIVNRVAFPSFKIYQKLLDAINAKVKDNFIGARVVKSFVQEDKEIEQFDDEVMKLAKINFKIGTSFSVIFPLLMLVGNLATIAAVYFASPIVIEDMSKFGDLASYITYLGYVMFALTIGGFLVMMAGRAMVSLQRINEIISYEAESVFTDEIDISMYNDIEFKNVCFKYDSDDRNSLIDINLKISKGETIGIVGATGSGKSTLVNLLSRLYAPQQGEILVDGVNLNKIKKSRIRKEVSVVLQQPYLFSGSIKDNILDGNLNASAEEMTKSATIAQAQEFISSRSLGFESRVMERGSNFSGGQKQRISIARGLVKNPSILILDDSTSALDARSEKLVKEGLESEYQNITKFIVSQKVSTIVNADKIIVLDNGKVDAVGTHKELLDSSSVYQEIYTTQKGVE